MSSEGVFLAITNALFHYLNLQGKEGVMRYAGSEPQRKKITIYDGSDRYDVTLTIEHKRNM